MGDRCPHEETVAGRRFVCLRPRHGWESKNGKNTLRARQRAGKISNPERHVMARAD